MTTTAAPPGPASTIDRVATPRRRRFRPNRLIDWMALPMLAILVFVIAYPAVRAVQLSFTATSLVNPGTPGVGWRNYQTLVHDTVFTAALKNTAIFSAASVVAAAVIGLGLALLAERYLSRWRIINTVLLTPWAVPTVVAAFLFRYMLATNGGLVNSVLLHLHLVSHPVGFITSPVWSMRSLIAANVWTQIPFFFLVILAAVRAVPNDVVEAARADGAGYWATVWHIKLHYLRGPVTIAALLMIITNFNNFAMPEALTGGGPGYSTMTLVLYVYNLAFQSYHVGYAAAAGVIWLIILLAVALLFVRLVRSEGSS